jgi:hypothetical protein
MRPKQDLSIREADGPLHQRRVWREHTPKQDLSIYEEDGLLHSKEPRFLIRTVDGRQGLVFDGFDQLWEMYGDEYDEIVCCDRRDNRYHFRLVKNGKVGFAEIFIKEDTKTVWRAEHFCCEYDRMLAFSSDLYLFFNEYGCRHFNLDNPDRGGEPRERTYKQIVIREYRTEGRQCDGERFPWGFEAPQSCLHEVVMCSPEEYGQIVMSPPECSYSEDGELVSHRSGGYEIRISLSDRALGAKVGEPRYWKHGGEPDDLPQDDGCPQEPFSGEEEGVPEKKARVEITGRRGKQGLAFGGWRGAGFSIYESEYDKITRFHGGSHGRGKFYSQFLLRDGGKVGFCEIISDDDKKTVWLHQYFDSEYNEVFIFSKDLYLFSDSRGCRYFNDNEPHPPDKVSGYYRQIVVREYRLEGEDDIQTPFPWGRDTPKSCLHKVVVCGPEVYERLKLNPVEFTYDKDNRLLSHRCGRFEILFSPSALALDTKASEPYFTSWTENQGPPPDDGEPWEDEGGLIQREWAYTRQDTAA